MRGKWNDFKEHIRYLFDKRMATGFGAQIGLLGVVMLIFVLLGASLLALTGIRASPDPKDDISFLEALWKSLMHAMDTGTVGSDTDPDFRAVMLLVSVAGLTLMAGLIGVISNLIQESLMRVRKGRSKVEETNYTLILGWSPAVFNVVRELIRAEKKSGSGEKKWHIVILAERDKVGMEDEIRAKLLQTQKEDKLQHFNNRIICRTGDPTDVEDLEFVKPRTAKSIVILAPAGQDHDSQVIKTILAVQHAKHHDKSDENNLSHIVYELRDAEKNWELAELVSAQQTVEKSDGTEQTKQPRVLPTDSSDVIARLIAQTCRQAGMSEIYTELLEYNDNQIYFKPVKCVLNLNAKTFKDALLTLSDAALIGLQSGGTIRLNPPMNTELKAEDSIIFIAARENDVQICSLEKEDQSASPREPSKPKPEKTLILGWNERGHRILDELNEYVETGSQVTVVANRPHFGQTNWHCPKERKQLVNFVQEDPAQRKALDGLNIGRFDHIIVLGDAQTLSPEQADMNTLRTQISQQKELKAVFDELLSAEKMEIYLKPAENYVKPGTEVSFSTLVAAAAKRNECAIGYRISDDCHTAEKNYGVTLNPKKSVRETFKTGDRIIVIAEKEWDEPSENGAAQTVSG